MIATYNSEKTLEYTLKSIISSKKDWIELVIQDGGSTDRTIEICNRYANIIDIFISKKDEGLYDALNQGTKLASGKYIFYMGSDDIFMDTNIDDLYKVLSNRNSTELLALPVAINSSVNFSYPSLRPPLPVVHHQGAIFLLDSLKSLGMYSINYKVHSDFDLMCRYINKFGIVFKELPICMFQKGGKSTSGKNFLLSIEELLKIYFQNGGQVLSIKWILFVIRPLYYYLSSILKK